MNHSFKIRSVKFISEKDNKYVFAISKKSPNTKFNIPKNQVLKFEEITISNPYTNLDEQWIDIVVTDWIWSKMDIESKLKNYKMSSDVVISNETHFAINWDFVIMKRRDSNRCFFCEKKIYDSKKTLDHLIPKAVLRAYGLKGGIPNNTVPCCLEDNREKANLHPEVYRELVRRKIHEGGDIKYRTILFTLNQLLKIS